MARETTKWPSTRWPITKIMSSDGCNGNRVPLEMGPWYDFREFGCHLGNVGLEGHCCGIAARLVKMPGDGRIEGKLYGLQHRPPKIRGLQVCPGEVGIS